MYLAGVIMHTVSLIFSLINHWRRRAGSFRECLDAPGGGDGKGLGRGLGGGRRNNKLRPEPGG